MAHTFEELKKKNVTELRKIAKEIEHDDLHGYTQMHKEHLVKALCKSLEIDVHEHHVAKSANKSQIKAQIKSLKTKRDEVIAEHNHVELKVIRRKIHKLKRTLKRTVV